MPEELVLNMKWISSRFRIGLRSKKRHREYVVTADAKLIDGQVERIQNNLVQQFLKKRL
jgi:hypothetical protein